MASSRNPPDGRLRRLPGICRAGSGQAKSLRPIIPVPFCILSSCGRTGNREPDQKNAVVARRRVLHGQASERPTRSC